MKNRTFEKGEIIFLITDCMGYIVTIQTEVSSVEKDENIIHLVWCNKTYTLSLSEYGRLFFGNQEEAMEKIKELPKRYSIIYEIVQGKILKNVCHSVFSEDDPYDICLLLNEEKKVSIKNIGETIFLTQNAARKKSTVPP